MDVKKTKLRIIHAGQKAVDELIKVAEEPIIGPKGTLIEDGVEIPLNSEELAADKLKNAAATKKLAIFDAFEILNRITSEKNELEGIASKETAPFKGFAERRAK